jgi:uncharacterized protein (DUF4415 family)
MPEKFKPFTDDERGEIKRRQLAAAETAARLAELISPDEDARLTAAAESDPDNPPLAEDQWARMRPGHEVHAHLAAASLRRQRGRPPLAEPKKQVTLRLDQSVIDHFRSGGPGWQSRINEVLKRATGQK